MLSDQELISHFIVAREYLETHTSDTVWRTALRIHELIRMNCPFWRQNEALADEVKFSMLLYSFCHEKELQAEHIEMLAGERYEEGHHEPILFSDTQFPTRKNTGLASLPGVVPPFQRQNVRAIIVQRELKRYLSEGLCFQDATELVYKLQSHIRDSYVSAFRNEGMTLGNIFYKRKLGPKKPLGFSEKPKIPEFLPSS